MKKISALVLGVLVLTAGCATAPDVTATYYHPRTDMEARVVRSFACTPANARRPAEGNLLYMAHQVAAPTVAYSADHEAPATINLGELNAAYANTEVALNWRDDRRLAGLNATGTGQGSEIVKAAIEVVAAAAARGDATDAQRATACNMIRSQGDKDVLSITFALTEDFDAFPARRTIDAIANDQARWAALRDVAGVLCLTLKPIEGSATPLIAPTARNGSTSPAAPVGGSRRQTPAQLVLAGFQRRSALEEGLDRRAQARSFPR